MQTTIPNDFRELLHVLHRGGKKGYWWVAENRHSYWWDVDDPTPYPEGRHNVFFGVHPCTKIPSINSYGEVRSERYVKGRIEFIAAVNCLYADFDDVDYKYIRDLDTPPSVVVSTGGGYHAYWLLEWPYILGSDQDRTYIRDVQAAWVDHVGADPSAKDLARILRPVGTTNYKDVYAPDYPTVEFVFCDLTMRYDIRELATSVADVLETRRKRRAAQTSHVPENVETECEKARAALEALNPERADKYDDRIKIGMALYWLGDRGRALWDEWLRTNGSFVPRHVERKWLSFDPESYGDTPITLGTLYHLASKDADGEWYFPNDDRTSRIVPPDELGTDLAEYTPLPDDVKLPKIEIGEACPWLARYVDFSRRWSPRAYDGYHVATGLWVLSTVAAHRIGAAFGKGEYPSLYLLLCGRTSLFAKSTTAIIGVDTLKSAELDWLLAANDSTPQAFIAGLTRRYPKNYKTLSDAKKERIRKRMALPSQRGWFYEEFGQHLYAINWSKGHMSEFRGIIRRFDDHEPYSYESISRGVDYVAQPYLALLGNLTPADLKPFAKKGSTMWTDGFWARFAFVVAPNDERGKGRFPRGVRTIPDDIVDGLREWHMRLGLPRVWEEPIIGEDGTPTEEITLNSDDIDPQLLPVSDDVRDAYYQYHDGLLDITAGTEFEDLDGNYARFSAKALRVATLFASIADNDIVDVYHFAAAQRITERWRRDLHVLIGQLDDPQPSEQARREQRIYKKLYELSIEEAQGPRTAAQVGRYLRGYSTEEIYHVLEALEQAGYLTSEKKYRTTYFIPAGYDETPDA